MQTKREETQQNQEERGITKERKKKDSKRKKNPNKTRKKKQDGVIQEHDLSGTKWVLKSSKIIIILKVPKLVTQKGKLPFLGSEFNQKVTTLQQTH
jgi:hypothetical protein